MSETENKISDEMKDEYDNDESLNTTTDDLETLRKQLKDKEDEIQQKDRDIAAIAAKKEQLLSEKKEAARKEKEALDKLKKEEDERLRKNGDWEKVVQLAEERARAAEERAEKLYQEQLQREIKTQAMTIASEMRGRPESMEILTDCVIKEIKSLVDENGVLSETNKTRVIQNMVEMAKYKPLLLGNQSTGGGAEGSGTSVSRGLDEMSEKEQRELYNKNPEKWRQLNALRQTTKKV